MQRAPRSPDRSVSDRAYGSVAQAPVGPAPAVRRRRLTFRSESPRVGAPAESANGRGPGWWKRTYAAYPKEPRVDYTRRRIAASAGGTLLAFALAGCSSSSAPSSSGAPTTAAPTATATPSSTPSGGAVGDTITIHNFAFSPAALDVKPGTTITVVNKDSVTHTLTSTATPAAFNTGDINAGATMTFKAPTKAGSYSYICTIHTFMHGTLTVQ